VVVASAVGVSVAVVVADASGDAVTVRDGGGENVGLIVALGEGAASSSEPQADKSARVTRTASSSLTERA
jgi:hypothetical protein